jgi:excisionase family DNA binding protein
VSEFALPIPDEWLEAIAERVTELLAERAPAANSSPYLSPIEAAEYLRADRQRVYDLLSSGRLTRHKDGSRVLVSRAELDAYLLPPWP